MRTRAHGLSLSILFAAGLAAAPALASPAGSVPDVAPLRLEPCRIPGLDEEVRCGTYNVFENRETRRGRMLPLRIVLLPARVPQPGREPVFLIYGGPGQTGTELAAVAADGWLRTSQDVVIVDQRGTGAGHRLDCAVAGSDADLQAYLEPIFQAEAFRACRRTLERRADLSLYSTSAAADDLDDVRRALGYDRIHLHGASYGTRFILTYLRRHSDHVRTAVMVSLVPFSFRNPLFHARSAQESWDGLVRECRAETACATTYPDLQADFDAVRAQLRAAPARVTISHPATGAATQVSLTEEAFGEAVRVLLYSAERGRNLPLLISRARRGDFAPFATAGLLSNRNLRNMLRLGMLLSVTCREDVARIRRGEIDRETDNTFLGSARVRQQMAACAEWPRGNVPRDYAAPLRSDVPVLLISGNLDPVTTPAWGEVATGYFTRSLHLVVPGGHAPSNDCTISIIRDFMRDASIQGLETSCVAALRPPAFALPSTGNPDQSASRQP